MNAKDSLNHLTNLTSSHINSQEQSLSRLTEDTPSILKNNNSSMNNNFNLHYVPTFYPTNEQFSDSLSYIASIYPKARKYGAMKIVPPIEWTLAMKLVFDAKPKTFKFKSRIQHLNQLSSRNQSLLSYIMKLTRYHKQMGSPFRIPIIATLQLDLLELRNSVIKRGAFNGIKDNQWIQIMNELGFESQSDNNLFTLNTVQVVKMSYIKLIHPFESFILKNKSHLKTNPLNDKQSKNTCRNCCSEDSEDALLFCEQCEQQFHPKCVIPELKHLVQYEWYCYECLDSSTIDIGFSVGKEFSLEEFAERSDLEFNKIYNSPEYISVNGVISPTPKQIEAHYWYSLKDPFCTIKAHYGADLSTSIHPSFFPSKEIKPTQLSTCSWNLLNLPTLPASLFNCIPQVISGCTIPWLYISHPHSTFCWHTEDHSLFSINYMHSGATKQWYTCSSDQSDKFRRMCLDIGVECGDMCTIISPADCQEHGIEISMIDQNQGEFVITFPDAFHAGFNHKHNIAEAVNFALPVWIPFGEACEKRYANEKKDPVFSHDDMIVRALSSNDAYQSVEYCLKELIQKIDSHCKERAALAETRLTTTLESISQDIDKCTVCHCYLYFTAYSCCTKRCFTHLCDCQKITIITRSIDQSILDECTVIMNEVPNWINSYKLNISKSIKLVDLESLIQLGSEIPYFRRNYSGEKFIKGRKLYNQMLCYLETVQRWKLKCNETCKLGQAINGDTVEALCQEYTTLGIELPEYTQLALLNSQIMQFKQSASRMTINSSIESLEACLSILVDYNVFVPEYEKLQLDLETKKWNFEFLRFIQSTPFGNTDTLTSFVLSGQPITNISVKSQTLIKFEEFNEILGGARKGTTPQLYSILRKWLEMGDKWRFQALSFLNQKSLNLVDAQHWLSQAYYIPVNLEVYNALKSIVDRVEEWKLMQDQLYLSPKIDIEKLELALIKAQELPLVRSNLVQKLVFHSKQYGFAIKNLRAFFGKSNSKNLELIEELSEHVHRYTRLEVGLCYCRTTIDTEPIVKCHFLS